MGLKNASSQFQCMMDDCLQSVQDTTSPFIDDILVGTCQVEGKDLLQEHDKDIRRTLDKLAELKFVAEFRKCHFFVREVEFCGFILGGGTRRPAPGKLMAIEKWERPTNITQLRSFLGFTNHYSSFVQGYADIVGPIQEKLKVAE